MSLREELSKEFIRRWNRGMTRLRVKMNSIYAGKGVECIWEETKGLTPFGLVLSYRPVITYQPPPKDPSKVPYDAYHHYLQEKEKIEEEIYNSFSDYLRRRIGTTLESFTLEDIAKIAREIDSAYRVLGQLGRTHEKFISREEVRDYLSHVKYLKIRSKWVRRVK